MGSGTGAKAQPLMVIVSWFSLRLIHPHHVENCLKAIEERRKEDLVARPAVLDDPTLAEMTDGMWDRLPRGYQWLREWEWV